MQKIWEPGMYKAQITSIEARASRQGTPYLWAKLNDKVYVAIMPRDVANAAREHNFDFNGEPENLVGLYTICRVSHVEYDAMVYTRIVPVDIIPPSLKDKIKMSAPFQELLNSLEAVGSNLRQALEHCDAVMKDADAPTFEKVSAKAFAGMIKKAGKELQIDITKAPQDQVSGDFDFNEF